MCYYRNQINKISYNHMSPFLKKLKRKKNNLPPYHIIITFYLLTHFSSNCLQSPQKATYNILLNIKLFSLMHSFYLLLLNTPLIINSNAPQFIVKLKCFSWQNASKWKKIRIVVFISKKKKIKGCLELQRIYIYKNLCFKISVLTLKS